MPLAGARPVREYDGADRRLLDEVIRPGRRPAVLRGAARDWPAVQAARRSDADAVAYLKRFLHPRPVGAIVGQPEIQGRFFYSDDMTGFNFTRGLSPLEPFLNRLLKDREHPAPLAMAVQSEPMTLSDRMFEQNPPTVSIWIGNRTVATAHFDFSNNIACSLVGRRRFTLFPPEQLPNLYVGPLELTPAGTPVSLVDLEAPDLARFPRFATAIETAETATLEPGDAIYIPFHWFHAVDSLAPVNFFANYWWNDARPDIGSPYDALIHAFYALKHLPPEHREVWRTVFDHYVFETHGDPAEHLPPQAKGVLGPLTPDLLGRIRATLRQILGKL
jgi:hypothetical protein